MRDRIHYECPDRPAEQARPSARSRVPAAACVLLAMLCGCVEVSTGEKEEAVRQLALGTWGGLPTVPVVIGDSGPYPFILDTGAAVTVVDLQLRDALELVAIRETEIGSPMGRAAATEVYELVDVGLGAGEASRSIGIERVECVALDLAAMLGGTPDAPRGVLSPYALTGYTLTLDFTGNRLELRGEPLPVADGQEILEYRLQAGLPTVPVRVGGVEIPVHLDSGSPGTLSLPDSYVDRLPLAGEAFTVGVAQLVDTTVTIRAARLDGDLLIGDHRFENPELQFAGEAEVGTIGNGLLQQFVLSLDPANRRLRLERPETSGAVVSSGGPRKIVMGGGKRRYGMRFMGIDTPELQIAGVDPGSPAALGGIESGDVIVAIQGTPTRELGRDERISALRSSPLVLTVRRDGVEHELTLSLD